MMYHGWFRADGSTRIRYYAEPTHDMEEYQISIPAAISSCMTALVWFEPNNPYKYSRFDIPDAVTTLDEAKAWALAIWRMT